MNLELSEEQVRFREEVSEFLRTNWCPETATGEARAAYTRAFRRAATQAGYLNRSIPARYGGSEQPADPVKADIIRSTFRAARAPMEVTGNGMALLVPTLLEWGVDWQKEKFVPGTVAGDIKWAQGYSEPGAGSDLASLRTRGELADGKWKISGQKIWTTLALDADYIFMLVRTEPDKPGRDGISYLLVDLRQPGIEIRPIRQITGEQNFCEVFFDVAETPADWIVGERGQGWEVSRSTFKAERNNLMGSASRTEPIFERLVELAKSAEYAGGAASENPTILERLAEIDGYLQAQICSGYYQSTRAVSGQSPGVLELTNKLQSTNILHRISSVASDLIGPAGLIAPQERGGGHEKWVRQILGSLGQATAGGTSNIQRNIIAHRGLDLPRVTD